MPEDKKSEEVHEHIVHHEEQKLILEKHIATAQWVQAIAMLTEAILISKLHLISNQSEGEDKVLTGIWVQTLGQLLESLGYTQQVSASDTYSKLNAQKTEITGDFLQSLGAALQGIGGVEVLNEDGEKFIIP